MEQPDVCKGSNRTFMELKLGSISFTVFVLLF